MQAPTIDEQVWWTRLCEGDCGRFRHIPYPGLICPDCLDKKDARARGHLLRVAYGYLPLPGLREVRTAQGITQEKLARVAGVSEHTILNIERGHNRAQARTARALARALGVDVEDLQGRAA